MSRILQDGKVQIDNINECRYMYNRICCRGDSMYCGDYPDHGYHSGCDDCGLFEREDMEK